MAGGEPCSRAWALARPLLPAPLLRCLSRPAPLAPLSGPAPRKLGTAPHATATRPSGRQDCVVDAPHERRCSPGHPDRTPLVTSDERSATRGRPGHASLGLNNPDHHLALLCRCHPRNASSEGRTLDLFPFVPGAPRGPTHERTQRLADEHGNVPKPPGAAPELELRTAGHLLPLKRDW